MNVSKQKIKAQRILLTGGGGFVGRWLAPELEAAAPDARLAVLTRGFKQPAWLERWTPIICNIEDENSVMSAVSGFRPDLTVHLAAQSSVGAGNRAADETWRVNFGGSAALARAIERSSPKSKMLFTSSGEVYGREFLNGPVTEDSPTKPQNAYAHSKLAAEWALGDLLPSSVELVIARAFNHSGPGQDERFVIPSFAMQIARIEAGLQSPILRVGNLDVERDFLHIKDVCDAYVTLVSRTDLPNRVIFNVSSGHAIGLRQVLGTMQSISGVLFDIEPDTERMRPVDIRSAVGDNKRIFNAVNWKPCQSIDILLKQMLDVARIQLANEASRELL